MVKEHLDRDGVREGRLALSGRQGCAMQRPTTLNVECLIHYPKFRCPFELVRCNWSR